VPPWHCSDLALGRWMRDFLDGNASTFETERLKSHTSFGLVLLHFKWVFLPFRYGVHGGSIGGCPRTALALQYAQRTKRCSKVQRF
jgi:hypothetical protein